ncbi:hypothetical protein GCM10027020_31190 [Nocardioides salsibiostraticola]
MLRFRVDTAGGVLLLLGLTERGAAISGRSLVDAIGRVVVDRVPLPVVEETVRFLGTTDKPFLRANLVGGVALAAGLAAPSSPSRGQSRGPMLGVVAGAIGLAAYVSSRRHLAALESDQDRNRTQIRVADPLPELIDGGEGWQGAEPLFTDIDRFYQTDVNLRSPLIDPATWRLQVVGLDGTRAQVTLDDLLELPLRERDALLICIHNRLGWDRLGHQRWTGVDLPALFEALGVELPADLSGTDLVMEAVDGYKQVLPLARALEASSWLVVGMGGQTLPAGHGFPARIMTPGLAGQYNGTKWLHRLTLAPAGQEVATWVARGWPRDDVKLPPMARIDHPGAIAMPPRLPQGAIDVGGSLTVFGTAWAPANDGVADVQVRIDDGPWISAELADDLGPTSWRRWRAKVNVRPGTHVVSARCVAADGTIQKEQLTPPFPDGATGHHSLRLRVKNNP